MQFRTRPNKIESYDPLPLRTHRGAVSTTPHSSQREHDGTPSLWRQSICQQPGDLKYIKIVRVTVRIEEHVCLDFYEDLYFRLRTVELVDYLRQKSAHPFDTDGH